MTIIREPKTSVSPTKNAVGGYRENNLTCAFINLLPVHLGRAYRCSDSRQTALAPFGNCWIPSSEITEHQFLCFFSREKPNSCK